MLDQLAAEIENGIGDVRCWLRRTFRLDEFALKDTTILSGHAKCAFSNGALHTLRLKRNAEFVDTRLVRNTVCLDLRFEWVEPPHEDGNPVVKLCERGIARLEVLRERIGAVDKSGAGLFQFADLAF